MTVDTQPVMAPPTTCAMAEWRVMKPECASRRPASGALTPAERAVVEGLSEGHRPKELAHQRGRSLSTIRTHIANAKRKTGARTLAELAGLAASPTWRRDGS